eukprot:418601-Pelagomonas_calceolata.AAC.3
MARRHAKTCKPPRLTVAPAVANSSSQSPTQAFKLKLDQTREHSNTPYYIATCMKRQLPLYSIFITIAYPGVACPWEVAPGGAYLHAHRFGPIRVCTMCLAWC